MQEELFVKVAEVIEASESHDVAKAALTKLAADLNLSEVDTDSFIKFSESTFKLSGLDTESLIKRALGRLGDKPEQVDAFLAGIDAFITTNNLDKTAGERVKIALAMDALNRDEKFDSDCAALWYKLEPALVAE